MFEGGLVSFGKQFKYLPVQRILMKKPERTRLNDCTRRVNYNGSTYAKLVNCCSGILSNISLTKASTNPASGLFRRVYAEVFLSIVPFLMVRFRTEYMTGSRNGVPGFVDCGISKSTLW